jgi:hypothetical protein
MQMAHLGKEHYAVHYLNGKHFGIKWFWNKEKAHKFAESKRQASPMIITHQKYLRN